MLAGCVSVYFAERVAVVGERERGGRGGVTQLSKAKYSYLYSQVFASARKWLQNSRRNNPYYTYSDFFSFILYKYMYA